MNKKIRFVLSFVLISYISIVTNVIASTDNYRNIFFFAEVVVSKQILKSGHIYVSGLSQVKANHLLELLWAKVLTAQKAPIPSILMSIIKIVTGIELTQLRSSFPSYIFIIISYFVIFRIFIKDSFAFLLAVTASMGPDVGPIGAFSILDLIIAITVLLLFILVKSVSLSKPKQAKVSVTILPLLLIWMFFIKPYNFVFISLIIFGVIAAHHIKPHNHIINISLIILSVYLTSILIIEFPAYRASFLSVLSQLGRHSLESIYLTFLGSIEGGSSLYEYSIRPYSLIYAGVTIPMAGVGALIIVHKAINKNTKNFLTILGIGIGNIAMNVSLLLSSESWISGRIYQISLPVILICVIVFFKYIDNYNKNIKIFVIYVMVISFAVAFALIAQGAHVQNHTYSNGDRYVNDAKWAKTYMDHKIIGEMKPGSIFISEGYKNYYYPTGNETRPGMVSLFYGRIDQYQTYFKNNQYNAAYYHSGMVSKGIYVQPSLRIPMSKNKYQIRIINSEKIYSTGNTTIVIPKS